MIGESELHLQHVLKQMLDIVKRDKLIIRRPKEVDGVPSIMSEFDFRNTLLDFPMQISPENISALIKKYKKPPSDIDYEQFVNDLLHSADPAPPSPTRTNVKPKLKELARYLYDRHTDLISIMEQLDKMRTGRITCENFCRAIPDFLHGKDVARIVYNKATNEIEYRKLQELLDQIDLQLPKPIYEAPSEDHPKFINEFARKIRSHGVILEDVFMKENRTKTGHIPAERFLQVLRQLRINVSFLDLKKVADYFSKDKQVDYYRFIKVIDHCIDSDYKPPIPEVNVEECKQAIIKSFIDRKLNVWSIFKPFDRTGTGKIPKQDFTKQLGAQQVDLDTRELTAVINSLTDKDNMVDYVSFAKEVYAGKNMSFDQTIDSVLQKLRDFIMEKNIRLSKALSIYDRDKSGLISTAAFVGSLRKLRFDFTEHDLALIREAYEDKNTKHFLQWKKICNEVDIVPDTGSGTISPTSSINFTPSMRELMTTSSRALQMYNSDAPTSENPRELRPIPDHIIPLYGRIYHALDSFGFDLLDELIRKDRFKKGTVPIHVFKQVISLLPLKVTDKEITELISFYSDPANGNIYYLSFSKDIDEFGNQMPPEKVLQKCKDSKEEEEKIEEEEQEEVEEDVQLSEILRSLKSYFQTTNSNLIETFRTYDKSHCGKIPGGRVATALSSTKVHIGTKEVDTLLKSFPDKKTPEYFNYIALKKAIDNVEDDPTNSLGKIPMTSRESEELGYVIHRLNETLRKKRWSFKRLFTGSDPILMPQSDFKTKIESSGLFIKTEEWQLIFKKYCAGATSDVDWERFVYDADNSKLSIF